MLAKKIIASASPPELRLLTTVGAYINGASFSFTGVDVGPAKSGRILVMLPIAIQFFGGAYVYTSLSVDGVAANRQVVSQADSAIIADATLECWTLPTSAGGPVTIAGTLDGNAQTTDIAIYELVGARDEAPYTSGSSLAVTPSVDLTLTRPQSAVLAAAFKSAYSSQVTDIALSGITEDLQFALSDGSTTPAIASVGSLNDAPSAAAYPVSAVFTGGGSAVSGHLLAAAWR